MKVGLSHPSPTRYQSHVPTIGIYIVPGAAGVLYGTQNQGLDVEHSGQKGAGIEDRAARAHVKLTKRYCVDNSGGKCLHDEVKFGSKIQKTIATFDTFETTVGGRIFRRPVVHFQF
ncbi:hypothetical protein R3P38DRAFT_2793046 [Favolaschia claudopus]|uniref:Uncharacterized protein n=1 Tax=Favolaschia claudopus TaxID=2862362 RepID=A0AAW0AEI0_9AGAR